MNSLEETNLLSPKDRTPLHVAVDGLIYQKQARGGISRIFNEILPRMGDQDHELHISLYASKPCRQPLPTHPCIRTVDLTPHNWHPARVWTHLRPATDWLVYSTTLRPYMLWHSTFFSLPPDNIRPRAIIMPVYDLIHQRYQEMFGGSDGERFREQQKRSILAADVVICISQTSARDVQEIYGVSPAQIRSILLACSDSYRVLNPDEPRMPAPTPKPFFLYVGSRLKHKNYRFLLEGYSRWSNRTNVDLVVVGTGWSPDERQDIINRRLSESIHLVSEASDQVLLHLYNQATALIFPSLWEGFGIPILEAMACGCPVAGSDIPSTREIAVDSPFYFDPTKIESLHHALDCCLTGGRGSVQVATGLEHVKNYSWDKTARHTLEVYRSLS